MSKIVKNLLIDDLKGRFQGVSDALVVSVAGMNSLANYTLRKELRSKNIKLLMVKNSLARRATEGTPLAPAFQQAEGALAVVWGGEDIVSLAKVVTKLAEDKKMAPFEARGGVMDGTRLTKDQVKDVSKWPSRDEQLSLLLGQIVGVGGRLASQLISVGGALASQIKQKAEGEGGDADSPAADSAAGGDAATGEALATTGEALATTGEALAATGETPKATGDAPAAGDEPATT